jgi:Hypervirulence associated proteins TUDOR domain
MTSAAFGNKLAGVEVGEGPERRVSMAKELKPGDEVAWGTQGATHGKVVRKLTSATRIKGHVAKPTKDDPQYLVKSDKSGAEAAHKPGELRRR